MAKPVKHYCNGFWRKAKLAPMGMAVLMQRGKEKETADRLNVQRFSDYELERMSRGTMAFRHFTYEDYCQDIPFSYL